MWVSVSYLAAASAAFLLILLVQQVSLAAAIMVLPLVPVFYLTLRSSFGRLTDARRHLVDLDRLYLSTIETLAMAIDAKDDVTHSHVRRVQAYAVGLAGALGVEDEGAIKAIKAAALLHDTGKLAVPEHILNKPGGLTPAEFEQMKRHVDIGADILSLVDFPFPVVPIVRCHHENWDGSGYPRGVKAEDIPIGARILSVVDCFDALTSDRPYRRALTDQAAIDILLERRGRMYDPRVVDTFIAVYRTIALPARGEHQALEEISRARQTRVAPPSAVQPSAVSPYAGDELLAFVSLARLASGTGSLGDLLALSTRLVRQLTPEASGAWYILSEDADRLVALEAFGPAADGLEGLTIRMGDRLTGWVAANRQPIVNSDAALDVGDRTTTFGVSLKSCLSVPLLDGAKLAGVLTLYAQDREAFSEDLGRLMQIIAPHVAQAILARRGEDAAIETRELKLVSSR